MWEVPVELLLLSHEEVDEAIPSLGLLAHTVQRAEPTATAVMAAAEADAVLVDARTELAAARTLCRLLSGAVEAPVVAIVSEGGLVAVNSEWGILELLMPAIGPAELDARLRLLSAHLASAETERTVLQLGDLVIDGYDFFGGTRTVDVHVRRLRAKLGSENESLIGTVRNVGYKAVSP